MNRGGEEGFLVLLPRQRKVDINTRIVRTVCCGDVDEEVEGECLERHVVGWPFRADSWPARGVWCGLGRCIDRWTMADVVGLPEPLV